ncbi:hypothetical protein [Tunturiibacter gelidiferens]|uniref:hypothetical protein n=1 Tax=Tunturiibacter gelidiferens TaxID=3069689 RepID=UPI003D9AF93E
MSRVSIEVAVGLGERDQLWGATVGVEGEGAVLFREAEILGDLGREGGAVGLFFEELGVDGGWLGVVGGRGGLRVLAVPALGGIEVYEVERISSSAPPRSALM